MVHNKKLSKWWQTEYAECVMAATRFLMQVYFTKFKPLKRVQNKIKNHSTNPTKIFKIHTYMHMCVCVCVWKRKIWQHYPVHRKCRSSAAELKKITAIIKSKILIKEWLLKASSQSYNVFRKAIFPTITRSEKGRELITWSFLLFSEVGEGWVEERWATNTFKMWH